MSSYRASTRRTWGNTEWLKPIGIAVIFNFAACETLPAFDHEIAILRIGEWWSMPLQRNKRWPFDPLY